MARTLPPMTWQNGFAEPTDIDTWDDNAHHLTEAGDRAHYTTPPAQEPLTSTIHNNLGLNVLRTWPTIYNGTESPHTVPDWWQPTSEVDVLICGAGPFGLEVALSLARQGVSFRIIDKAEAPLLAGRADAVQPRSLELLHSWGLAQEFHDEGPILDHTAIFRDGQKVFYNRTTQCDSRYKGNTVITQGQAEKIYIRDLLRHKHLVERCKTVESFEVHNESEHPVRAIVNNSRTGEKETLKAKYLVGSDGASSTIREQLNIAFDGNTTNIYWAITDCRFKTDYPYITTFGIFLNSEHGACIIVPREDGYTRIYTQISGERATQLAEKRRERAKASAVGETRVFDHEITVEEVLEMTNKVFAPYKLEYAAPISWFAVWKVSERVARSFSSKDLRVHIGGDAAHVHSVLGAFGFNSSIYDAANLGWKLGLSIRGLANPKSLLPTYDQERRLFANRVIRCSGAYMRYLCNSSLPLAQLRGLGEELETHEDNYPSASDQTVASDQKFLGAFFKRNAIFLMGMEFPIMFSPITSSRPTEDIQHPTTVKNGARAPNPRICFDIGITSYLYDKMLGSSRFHILVFGSDMQGPVREELKRFSQQHFGPHGVLQRFGGSELFNVILITKVLPHEVDDLLLNDVEMAAFRTNATVVFDDRVPDEDAHCWYGINHARGAAVVVRPDLVVGTSVWPGQSSSLAEYFGGFLVDKTNTCRPKLNEIESYNHVIPTTILGKEPKGLTVNVSSNGAFDRNSPAPIQV